MAKKLSTLVTQKIGSPCSHICVKLCESTLLQGHSHSNHHGQDGGGFSAIFQVGREDQFLRRTSDELFTVLMISSCYQYCFSFWFRCFRLSWSPTLFTGGYLTKRNTLRTFLRTRCLLAKLTHIFLISLEPSHKFHIQRKTTNMGVTFYVKDNFRLAV